MGRCMPAARIAATALLALCAAGLPAGYASDRGRIRPAPAFTAAELGALPRDGWITNGGNLYNQRYSPLAQIDRENVKDLKAVWRTSLRGSGMSPRSGNQAQPIVYDGVIYIMTGENDAFAVDVETGEILWEYRANIDPEVARPCCSWVGRGLAIGDGKVFVGQLDAKLVALDQRTGKVVWSIQAEDPKAGYAIASAPLYYDGLLITGFAGSDLGTRGRVKAYDAKTGRLRWTFYTVPGPGEFGHETWPQDSDAWKHGGAPMWQTPAVDPELGLIYFATGNPGPDLNGSVRPGDNLFSVSIVAIEAKTGKYRWHFQQVHHDIWDYDSANPVILFDAPYDGRMRKGIAQAGKTGWVYILDRVTGEPLIGIEERPVPQEPRQATAPTQPFPIGDAIVPQEIDIVPEGARLIPGTGEIPNKGRIFTPFWTEEVMVKPGTMGGANWPPSSYDPETHLLYVCATDRISTFQVREPLETPGPNKVYMGGRFGQAQIDDRGIFAALDVRTNRLKWRQAWREICYSGSIVTAGGLLFVGRTDGRLTALDKSTGELLWEFMTDAGVNTTATTFEYDGEQYVVVHAGGGVFAGGKRGDGIWAFSLKGTMDPVKPETAGGAPARGGAAAPPSHGDEAPGAAGAATRAANVENGERIYRQACAACHGVTGEGGQGGGAPLVNGLALQHIIDVTSAGRNNMPAFRDVFTRDELRDIGAYIVEVLSKKK